MRVRLSVDVEPELKRRVKIAAASKNVSVKDYVEGALVRALRSDRLEDTGQDQAWLETDLSRLGEIEHYEWGEGEIDEGAPLDEAIERTHD